MLQFPKIVRVLFKKIKTFQGNIEVGHFLSGDVIKMLSVRPRPDIKGKT